MKLSTVNVKLKIKAGRFKKQFKDWVFKLFEHQIMEKLSLQPYRVVDKQAYKVAVIKSREYISLDGSDYNVREQRFHAKLDIKQRLSREAYARVMFTEGFLEQTQYSKGYIDGYLVLGVKVDEHNPHMHPPFSSKP